MLIEGKVLGLDFERDILDDTHRSHTNWQFSLPD